MIIAFAISANLFLQFFVALLIKIGIRNTNVTETDICFIVSKRVLYVACLLVRRKSEKNIRRHRVAFSARYQTSQHISAINRH